MEKDASLDTIGLYCPVPLLLVAEKLKEIGSDQILEILASDPDIIKDMPIWCKQTGNKFLSFKKEDGIYKVYIRKV